MRKELWALPERKIYSWALTCSNSEGQGQKTLVRDILAYPMARKSLIKKVLPPLGVRPSDHPHNVPAGMEREWPRLLKQLHFSLSQQPVAFAPVAGMAACHQIFPCGRTSAGTRDHVVQGQIPRRKQHATVLAGVAIAQKNVFAGEG